MLNAEANFSLGSLRTNINAVPQKVERLIAGVLLRQENVSTGYMKTNARWTDRTSNARNGLHSVYSIEGDTHILTLTHGVPYGIWLEVRYAGRYAIILESVQKGGADVMRLLSNGLGRL